MARVRSEKQLNSFVKGIITEASPLTYPENASLDEDNFVLKRDGSRERRLGVDYESGYNLIATGLLQEDIENSRQSFHKWENPSGDTTISIGVIRINGKLWFINLLVDPISQQLLNGGDPITIEGLNNAEIDTAVVNNYLVIVSKDLDKPVLLAYDRETQLISQTFIPIMVRDIWGVVDGLKTEERPTTLTPTHEYNLINQGWNNKIKTTCNYANEGGDRTGYTGGSFTFWNLGDAPWANYVVMPDYTPTSTVVSEGVPAIACTYAQLGYYPSNADIWSLGKIGDAASADFAKYKPETMIKESIDVMEAPKGSFIIDAFDRGVSRRTLYGNPNLPLDQEQGRLTTVASFAGRIFYSGVESKLYQGDSKSPNYSNYIFYSQLATSADKFSKCYQDADPTSPNISDRIDTDGGTIQIPAATKIVKLVATRSSLLVFAENGVFEVFGDTGGFTGTSHQVSKVASHGCSSPRSIIEAYGAVLAWTKAGIFSYVPDQVSGRYTATSVSLQSIQTLYNSWSDIAKSNVKGYYDEKENIVRWLFNDNGDYSETSFINRYNRELVFDLTLQSYYLQSINTSVGPYVCDYIDIPNYATSSFDEAVFVGTDEVYVSTNAVVAERDVLVSRSSQFSFLTMVGTNFTVSKYTNTTFYDWQTYDGVGISYLSYLLTGHEIFGDILRHKQSPYIWFYFKRTEDGYSEDSSGNLFLDNPSSCLVNTKWNWTDSANSGQWGSQFQAYRFRRNYIPSGAGDTFDYGYEVVVTKNKLRGSGRSLSLLIQSEAGKDMKLLGWAHVITGDSLPDGA